MTKEPVGLKGWLVRRSAAANTREAWLTIAVVFVVLGVMAQSGAYLAIGLGFLVVGFTRKSRHRTAE
jgi:hypothetical protein